MVKCVADGFYFSVYVCLCPSVLKGRHRNVKWKRLGWDTVCCVCACVCQCDGHPIALLSGLRMGFTCRVCAPRLLENCVFDVTNVNGICAWLFACLLACLHAGLATSVWKKVLKLNQVNSVTSRCVIVTSQVMPKDKTGKPTTQGIPRQTPIQVLTPPNRDKLRWSDENLFFYFFYF